MLEIDILDSAEEFLRTLPRKHASQILDKIEFLAQEPYTSRSKALEGFEPFRRYRSGNYRIIYFVQGKILRIVLIGKRNDDAIYRRLGRKV